MATYAKILKDNSGNFILPYTRSKFVYMDDNTTVETAINNIKNQGGYTLPTASSSTLGGVKIGNNINISSGTISVPTGSTSTAGVLSVGPNINIVNGKISLTKDNITYALGYTPPTTDTKYTLPTASSSTLGGVKIGSNISISSGTISVKTATTSALGVVKIGSNISVSSGTISVPTATTSALGVVKIGSNISVSSGKISLTKDNITSALGYTPANDSDNVSYNQVAQTIYIDSNNANNTKTYSTGWGSSATYHTVWGCSQGLILGSHNEIDAYPNSSSTVSIPAYNISGGLVCGSYCNSTPDGNYAKKKIVMLVGNGSSSAKSNSYRRNVDGTASGGTYSSNGADYAEYFEWEDSNINNEDRRGLFVTLNGDKIKLASKDDNYILGIISGNPTVIGDSADLYWKDQYKRDIFGIPIYSEESENNLVLNPDYDSNKGYIPRSDRKEWDPVGLTGKLICIDDGTCEVNGYCYPSKNGIGTKSDHGYRVMKRIDDTHIQVLVR